MILFKVSLLWVEQSKIKRQYITTQMLSNLFE